MVEGCQQRGEVLFAMSEIVFQVVTLGFQRVVVFVFHLPPGASRLHNRCHGLVGDPMVCGKGIFIELLAIGTGDGDFTPINQQCIVIVAQRHLIEVAVSINFLSFARPPFADDCG